MGLLPRSKHRETADLPEGNANAAIQVSPDREKEIGVYDDSPVKFLSMRSLAMGVLVSMGGFIFGYDTGGEPLSETSGGTASSTNNCRSNIRLS